MSATIEPAVIAPCPKGYYSYPQETWSEAECKKLAKHWDVDGYGTKHPRQGYLGSSASIPPRFGAIRYNGGCSHDGKWYPGEYRPLPIIPDTYEIIRVLAWGWYIQLKQAAPKKPASKRKKVA